MCPAISYFTHALDRYPADRDDRHLGRSSRDRVEALETERPAIRMRSGCEHGTYNKIVGSFCPCGFRLREVVHRLTDPPQRIERTRRADRQAAVAELDTRRWNGQRDVETVVHEQSGRLTVGQSDGQVVMLAAAERTAARMKSQLGPPAFCKLARDVLQIRSPRDALIGDRVQARQRWSHVNLALRPAFRRAPRSHSSVGMRSLPAGCTSEISTEPPAVSLKGPVAVFSDPSAERILPGGAV